MSNNLNDNTTKDDSWHKRQDPPELNLVKFLLRLFLSVVLVMLFYKGVYEAFKYIFLG